MKDRGIARHGYPVVIGGAPVSTVTSGSMAPFLEKNIGLAYLPWAYAQEGRKLTIEYFGEAYPVEVAAVGYKPLYDPENLKPRS